MMFESRLNYMSVFLGATNRESLISGIAIVLSAEVRFQGECHLYFIARGDKKRSTELPTKTDLVAQRVI